MVLMRVPVLSGKLEDSWDGPYEVLSKVNRVNYMIAVPKHRTKKKIVHRNNLKEWVEQHASVLRIVAVAEESDELVGKLKLSGDELTEQKKMLDGLLAKFGDVLDSNPGLTQTAVHKIDTGDVRPIRSLPYRLCPATTAGKSGIGRHVTRWDHRAMHGALVFTNYPNKKERRYFEIMHRL